MQESFNGHFKADYIWVMKTTTVAVTERIVYEAVFDHNNRRLYSSRTTLLMLNSRGDWQTA